MGINIKVNKMNKHQECKGCNSNMSDNCNTSPSFKHEDINRICYCPCQICLIKSMCNEPCNKSHTYIWDWYWSKSTQDGIL